MRGTFFSADFVEDNNGNLRLIELNTDTTIVDSQIDDIDWSGLISVLSSSNCTELNVVYKPYLHEGIVNDLSASIQANAPFIVGFGKHEENIYSLYPMAVDDSDGKFVLRMAYDEGAIFDSTYCKSRKEMLRLFSDATSGSYVVPFYHSSSADGVANTLDYSINGSTQVPDASLKSTDASYRDAIKFYKIGNESQTNTERWNGFINNVKEENKVIEQYCFTGSSLSNGAVTSIRTFNVVYGSDLTVLPLLEYKVEASFDLPTDISGEYNSSNYASELSNKHYFEYTTNFIKFGLNGLYESHSIYKADDSTVMLKDIAVGDEIKSYFVSGSPQVEQDYIIRAWSHPGNSLPSGSYVTSSAVVFKEAQDIKHGSLVEVKIDDDAIFTGTGKQFLVYESSSNNIKYKLAGYLDHTDDYVVDLSGSLKDLTEVNFYLTGDDIQLVEVDVEDTDTYIISGSTDWNGAVSHNAPCFVAGTKIETEFGEKNIEDIDAGDVVLTYNHATGETQYKEVRQVCMCSKEKTVVYTFDNNKTLEGTYDHPLYCPDKGYVSYKPNLTAEMYDLVVEQAEIGDRILTANNEEVTIIDLEESPVVKTVYNLKKVEDNHNFFANGLLAHNRCFIAGTEITLGNKDVKNIENIVVGDEVLTYNEETNKHETGIVGELKQHEVDSVLKINFFYGNSVTTTKEHPFYVSGKGWVKAGELIVEDVCKQTDGSTAPITSIEHIEEKHLVYNLLNVTDNHNFYANGILVHNK